MNKPITLPRKFLRSAAVGAALLASTAKVHATYDSYLDDSFDLSDQPGTSYPVAAYLLMQLNDDYGIEVFMDYQDPFLTYGARTDPHALGAHIHNAVVDFDYEASTSFTTGSTESTYQIGIFARTTVTSINDTWTGSYAFLGSPSNPIISETGVVSNAFYYLAC